MPTTVAQIESILIQRCGGQLAYAKMDAVTVDGTNASLRDPIAVGVGSLGYPLADPSAPTDGDLAAVGSADMGQLLDVAELRCLESILGNRASPDQMADTNNQQWHGRLWEAMERRAARLKADIEKQYGIGLGTLEAGVFDLGFAATTDPATGRVV